MSLADNVATSAFNGKDIALAIPTRTRSNTLWNKKRGILQMGDAKASRELFNLNQAKQFMQTVLHGDSIKQLIEAEKTLSLRGMFYKALHTIRDIDGRKVGEEAFAGQDESDCILEDLEVSMGASARSCTSTPRSAARWSATPMWTAATRSIAGGWAPAATPCRASPSRT